jgi:hypothetical protein
MCYNDILEMIWNKESGNKIFVSINETYDTKAHPVATSSLKPWKLMEVFLLMNEVPESVNHSTICKLFNRAMFLLWPEGM